MAVRNRGTKPSLANLATADAVVFVCLLVLSLLTSNWAVSQSSTLIRAECCRRDPWPEGFKMRLI